MNIKFMKDGDKWCCFDEGVFVNLKESKVGFGETKLEALKSFDRVLEDKDITESAMKIGESARLKEKQRIVSILRCESVDLKRRVELSTQPMMRTIIKAVAEYLDEIVEKLI